MTDISPVFTLGTYRDILLFSDIVDDKIYEVVPDAKDISAMKKSLLLMDLLDPYDLAFDPTDKQLYWSDVEAKKISRASLDGKNHEVIIDEDLDRPQGIAVDATGRNLYWSDYERKTIEVSKLDGTNRKLLHDVRPFQPVGIALDPTRGYVYGA